MVLHIRITVYFMDFSGREMGFGEVRVWAEKDPTREEWGTKF